jgi:non-canonical purine NTP pyrophosphatase (RdgB/HAM1 family)
MKTIPFTLITGSEGKVAEFERILCSSVEHRELDLPELQAINVEDVAGNKVLKAYEFLKRPVMVEDSGVFIKAWDGLPGALIKWFVRTVGEPGICRMMKDFHERDAYAKTAIATFDGVHEPKVFVGIVYGKIADQPAGNGGFGWDKVFIPNGAVKTFGEMSGNEKDQYSMRRKAIESLMQSINGLD